MNRTQIFSQYENTDAELIALDVLEGNITAFHASFNNFSEMALNDGRVIRRIEQPGGGATYSVKTVEDVDAYMNESGEWWEPEADELIRWIAVVEA